MILYGEALAYVEVKQAYSCIDYNFANRHSLLCSFNLLLLFSPSYLPANYDHVWKRHELATALKLLQKQSLKLTSCFLQKPLFVKLLFTVQSLGLLLLEFSNILLN